jgi:anthranilate synthase component 1
VSTPGSAKALTRRLYRSCDALALYAGLTERGARTDTMMVETLAGPSLLMDQAALRIECRGREVRVDALTSGGATLLGSLEKSFAGCVRAGARLTLRFPLPSGDDSEARLTAPSPFDVLRALSTALRSETPEEPFTLALLGTVAFDHVDLFEVLPQAAEDPVGFPDFLFWLAESLVVIEQGLAPRLVCAAKGRSPRSSRRRAATPPTPRRTLAMEPMAMWSRG